MAGRAGGHPPKEEYLRWWFGNRPGLPSTISQDSIAEYVAAYREPGAMSSGFDSYRAVLTDVRDMQERSRTRLAIPVLGVGGEHSFGAAVGASLGRIADSVQSVVIDGAGHWVPDEKPVDLACALLGFFSGQAAAAAAQPLHGTEGSR